ncbi:MAG TPA: hypothetical protein VF596_18785 [Pyrinomonadaceae bacterium]|jgi:hypothetical protein
MIKKRVESPAAAREANADQFHKMAKDYFNTAETVKDAYCKCANCMQCALDFVSIAGVLTALGRALEGDCVAELAEICVTFDEMRNAAEFPEVIP